MDFDKLTQIDPQTRAELEAEAGGDRLDELATRLIASIEEMQRGLDDD